MTASDALGQPAVDRGCRHGASEQVFNGVVDVAGPHRPWGVGEDLLDGAGYQPVGQLAALPYRRLGRVLARSQLVQRLRQTSQPRLDLGVGVRSKEAHSQRPERR